MRILKTLMILLLSGGLIVFLAFALPAYRRGTRLLSVQSNSMEPVFAPGDAVIMQPVIASQLDYDDIVSYRSAADPRVIISHRLVDIDSEAGMLYTQGDNTDVVDEAVASGQVVGKVTRVIPRAGYVLDVLNKPIGIIATVYLPGSLILLAEGKRLARRFKKPAYQLYGYGKLKHRRV